MTEETQTFAPLRICMVSDDFLPGATGVGTHVQTVSAGLAARGHSVSVITTRRAGEPAFEVWKGVRVHRVFTLPVAGFYQGLPTRGRIERIFDEERPDLVHQHYLGFMLMQVSAVARRRQLKQVYTHHMTVDVLVQPWFMRPWRPVLSRLIVRGINQMNLVISVSVGIARLLPKEGIQRPILVISNPVDFPEASQIEPSVRDGEQIVFFAGRLEPEKNLSLLMNGFEAFSRQFPSAKLWIAGRGSQENILQQHVDKLGIARSVKFLGFLNKKQLAGRYLAADVFVLPSLVETQGLVAMEAMWYGKPVFVADSVASREDLVPNGDNGEIFDHRDPLRLADCLITWFKDPDRMRRAGREGQNISRQWEINRIIHHIEGAYQNATIDSQKAMTSRSH